MLDNNHGITLDGPARTLAAAGLSVIPVGTDKRPQVSWKRYQQQPPALGELGHWFIANGTPAAPALAVVCGAVSGNLTVLDFDRHGGGELLYEDWAAMVEARAPELLATLPRVETPSGGLHVYMRCARCEGNQALAVDAAGETRIETRGEGGYVVAPPSPGYRTVHGSIRAIPRIGEQEYAILLQCARALAEAPAIAAQPPRPAAPGSDRPGDAYNARATLHDVADLLCRHGWTAGRAHADKIPMTRPGKSPREGISGDVAFINGIPTFTQFSSNGGPFEPEKGYSAFAVYALLEHAGDYRAAARALGGQAAPQPVATLPPPAAPKRAQEQQQAPEEREWKWREHGMSLAELLAIEFPEPRWFVDGILPSGTTIVAGAPKTGKSLLGWQIALAASAGGTIFGSVTVAKRPVLYICLEDSRRLVQKRVRRMLDGDAPPDELTFYCAWRPLLAGGIDDLAEYLAEHPGTDIIIDTFENLRAPESGQGNAYRQDYAGLKPLTTLAHEHDVNILLVHHTSKMERADVLATVNGSFGLSGAVDNVVVLQRVRFGPECVLSIAGRDLDEDLQLAFSYDPATYRHTLLGEAANVAQTAERNAVLDVLRGIGGALRIQDIADRLGRSANNALRKLLSRMVVDNQLVRTERGTYEIAPDPSPPEEESLRLCDFVTDGTDGETPLQAADAMSHKVTKSQVTGQIVRIQCPCGYTAGREAPYDPDMVICGRCGKEHLMPF